MDCPMKRCSRCGSEKPRSMFSADRRHSVGLQSQCKDCKRIAASEWRARNIETARARDRERYRRDPQRRLAFGRRARYGVTQEWYDAMLGLQDGLCAICERPFTDFKRGAAVDHCHKTGFVRGLLCGACNRGLEPVERPGFVERAREYLHDAESRYEHVTGDNVWRAPA